MRYYKKLLIIVMLFFIVQGHSVKAYKHDLAICAIFQNEGRFLKEWVEFHMLAGVQHFFLYNNNSTDNYLEVLKPYLDAKKIDLIPWDYPMKGNKLEAQVMAYNDCLRKARGYVKWVAFLDLDEFLFPVQKSNLLDFLKEYEAFGAVCANWLMFGTSNVNVIPNNTLLIEALTMCNLSYVPNIHIKSIVRPERVKRMSIHNAHVFNKHFFQVTADKVRFSGPFAPSVALDKVRINHYWMRDKKWLLEVKIPRRIRYDPKTTAQSMFLEDLTLNKEHDYAILKYRDELKKESLSEAFLYYIFICRASGMSYITHF